jgi:cytochrome P450
MCVLLLIAGHETTVNLIGNGLLTLLRHPDQLNLLRRQPEYLTSAIEEMLRYESPVQRSTPRFAAEPFVIGGERVEAGQQISLMFGAANRDPAFFRSGSFRYHPPAESAPGVRDGDPLLSGRSAGAHRSACRVYTHP